jgi:tetratricopeptide (TPR) repeat protein
MIFDWFNAREATEVGTALADQFIPGDAAVTARRDKTEKSSSALAELLRTAERAVRGLRLNFYKKAKFANSFKWRLIENGIERQVADELTQTLIVHLSQARNASAANAAAQPLNTNKERMQDLLARGNKAIADGDHEQTVALLTEYDALNPGRPDVLNSIGAALMYLGRISEAEQRLREALDSDPNYIEALVSLAGVLQGNPAGAEEWLRRALKVNPKYPGVRSKLGISLASAGRVREAKIAFRKALKLDPNDADALLGMGGVARAEGRFDQAESYIKRVLAIQPRMPAAWTAIIGIRKMTKADRDWAQTVEKIAAASGLTLWEESDLRFALGKYHDDVEEYDQAFESYRRGNELLKSTADRYKRDSHAKFVDDMARVYTRGKFAPTGSGGSDSAKPVFVVGMPRSGTSLVEQIIASHPGAKGAGELDFWLRAASANFDALREGTLSELVKKKLADDYLRLLVNECGDAERIVDKTPGNADFVALIRSVFPHARFIRTRRDPIDTCLSCYFQRFSTGMHFTFDLNDLADYYRNHQRLMQHWREALPSGSWLDVSYEDLVADQETWTRKIIEFIGLEWDDRCLAFHETSRSVTTASAWQVRQKIYRGSVERWRHYEKFIGPLKALRD